MEFHRQYAFVQSSRQVLLDYCKTIAPEDFLTENSNFGRGSIRNLLVHIGTTYEFWLGKHALQMSIKFTEYNSVQRAEEAAAYFTSIDLLVEDFIRVYAENYRQEMEIRLTDKSITATPLKVFTHVITHEYHHKGQILSLSRHLGYVPVDTDVMR
ncbi:DinB family protein [soil metagenome]